MADPFAQLIPEARSFLEELARDNTRDWFHANKTRYEAHLKTPSQLLQEQICADFRKRSESPVTAKLFRPQRDIRFSKDKTPYHTHLHMLWQVRGTLDFGVFLGISPGSCRIGGGVMSFDKSQILTWRSSIDGSQGAAIASALETLAQQGFKAGDPELKRVPSPYDKDHPQADLLRRKSLTLWRDLPTDDWSQPLMALNSAFADLRPLRALLTAGLTAANLP